MGTPKEVFRSLRNYLAGQFVGATRDETLLDELLKCLFCKLYVELELVSPLKSETSSIDHAKAIRGVFSKVREDFPDIYTSQSEILLDPETIYRVMTDCSFSLIDATSVQLVMPLKCLSVVNLEVVLVNFLRLALLLIC